MPLEHLKTIGSQHAQAQHTANMSVVSEEPAALLLETRTSRTAFFGPVTDMLDSFSHQCSDFAERESPRGNGQCTFNAPSRFHNNIITSVRLTGQLQTSSQPAAAFGDDCSRLTISLPFLIVAGKAKQSCPSVGFLVFVGW